MSLTDKLCLAASVVLFVGVYVVAACLMPGVIV